MPQRLAIFLRTLATKQHHGKGGTRWRCPRVRVVTVYRTLELLTELGIVRRMGLGDGSRYELVEDYHLICESCGDISEFQECPLVQNVCPWLAHTSRFTTTALRSTAAVRGLRVSRGLSDVRRELVSSPTQ